MKKVHIFRGAKGGVGCTTLATGFACWLAWTSGETVSLVGVGNDDVASVLVNGSWKEKVSTVSVSATMLHSHVVKHEEGYVVIDAGTTPVNFPSEWHSHLVIDNHYLALRRAVQSGNLSEQYEDLAVLFDDDSALSLKDCSLVTKLPVFFSVQRNERIARSVDAGLFPNNVSDFRPNSEVLV